MKLENIRLPDAAVTAKNIIRLLEALPDNVIDGITPYGNVRAEIKGHTVVVASCGDPSSRDSLVVNVPDEATKVHGQRDSSNRPCVFFEYKGNLYTVCI